MIPTVMNNVGALVLPMPAAIQPEFRSWIFYKF
jgi:hypothetical protein